MPLHLVMPQAPFEKSGLDYVGPIKPATKGSQSRYIIIAMDYVTKWEEAKMMPRAQPSSYMKISLLNLDVPWK